MNESSKNTTEYFTITTSTPVSFPLINSEFPFKKANYPKNSSYMTSIIPPIVVLQALVRIER